MIVNLISDIMRNLYLKSNGSLDTLVDDADPNAIYMGFAKAGSSTSEEKWIIYRVKRIDGITYTRMADADERFIKIFNNRAIYSYIEP
jgi:hypothetical protein